MKKTYHILVQLSNGNWCEPISGQYISLTFWRGWKAGVSLYYPSYSLRLIDSKTREIVEEFIGNTNVMSNINKEFKKE